MKCKLQALIIILLLMIAYLNLPITSNESEVAQNTSKIIQKDNSPEIASIFETRGNSRSIEESFSVGGSWLDSFESDDGIDWSMSDHLKLYNGNARINISVLLDNHTVGLWHFDEGVGNITYDETYIDIVF